MKEKVTALPINPYKAVKRKLGKRLVPCMVSGRYLQLPETSTLVGPGNDFLCIDVMTINEGNQPHKICELVLTRQDLEAALQACKTKG